MDRWELRTGQHNQVLVHREKRNNDFERIKLPYPFRFPSSAVIQAGINSQEKKN